MRTIVIAPHPDDELIGVGGTLLRRKAGGGTVAWLIATEISTEAGWSEERVTQRSREIDRVSSIMHFDEVFPLRFPTTRLDQVPTGALVDAIGRVFRAFQPEEVLLPHRGDVHSDHAAMFAATVSCVKWFRYPSIRRVLAYETLSETDFGLRAELAFRPNVFVDIEHHLEAKLEALATYKSEIGAFPFPRSNEAIRALATYRGATSGFVAAEAFELLMERF